MITRPLELQNRLSKARRDWDWLFVVNVGLLGLFFTLFGSRFVLSSGLGTDFRLPASAKAQVTQVATTHFISVKAGGIIFADPGGNMDMVQLKQWLRTEAQTVKEPRLLIRAGDHVSLGELAEIYAAAEQAGFAGVVCAAEVAPEKAARY